jgi:hypothetical protein
MVEPGVAAIIVGAMITGGGTISAVAVAKILSNGSTGDAGIKGLLERLVSLQDVLVQNTIAMKTTTDSSHQKLGAIDANHGCLKTELSMHYKDIDHRLENINTDMTNGLNSIRNEIKEQ